MAEVAGKHHEPAMRYADLSSAPKVPKYRTDARGLRIWAHIGGSVRIVAITMTIAIRTMRSNNNNDNNRIRYEYQDMNKKEQLQ